MRTWIRFLLLTIALVSAPGVFAEHTGFSSTAGITHATALLHLPMFYNPDECGQRMPVEDQKFEQTGAEIAAKFGGGFLHRFRMGEARGFWWDKGVVDHDELAVLEVDIADTQANREWLRSYAQSVLMSRFHQKAIYMKFVGAVDTLLVSSDSVQ